ncbi:MAG: argininosuccinate synthase, partial [Rikenellaceae bacterium]
SKLTKEGSEKLTLTFVKGELTAVNGVKYGNIAAIQKVQEIAGAYAIGRDMHIGDTIIGIKGRVGFEAAAAMVIIKAHHMLEKHTLTKWQLFWKEQIANFYANHLHEGQYYDPAMRDMEAMFQSSQEFVSGNVIITLYPYRFEMVGIESDHDLMSNKFGSYGEMNNSWSGDDVRGFGKIFGNQVSIYRLVNDLNKK